MTDTIYFAGNTMAAFAPTVGTFIERTDVGTFDSSFVPNSIILGTVWPDYMKSWAFSATGTVWFKFNVYHGGNVTPNSPFTLVYNGTQPVFKIENLWGHSDLFQAFYWDAIGATWTSTGSNFTLSDGTLYAVTIQLVLGSSFTLYANSTPIVTGSGWANGVTTATNVLFAAYNNDAFVSEIIVGNYDLRSTRYKMMTMNGDSAVNTGGAGTYTDVSEIAYNDSTIETVSVSGNKMGQTYQSVTLPANYTVGAVCMSARGLVTTGDGKLGLRTHSTNYSSAGKGYGAGFGPEGRIDMTNPNTGIGWTAAEINALETYIEAS